MAWKFSIKGHRGRRTYGPYIAVYSSTHGPGNRIVAVKPNGKTTTFGKVSRRFTITAELSS